MSRARGFCLCITGKLPLLLLAAGCLFPDVQVHKNSDAGAAGHVQKPAAATRAAGSGGRAGAAGNGGAAGREPDERDAGPGPDAGKRPVAADSGPPPAQAGSGGRAANSDAAAGADAEPDPDADGGMDPTAGFRCDDKAVCASIYPCVDATSGYTCRGQFFDWPIESSATTSHFVDNGDGTVTDLRSGLVWQKELPTSYAPICFGDGSGQGMVGDKCTWEEANTYCAGLSLAGGGWRLPTKAELESIVDDSRADPSIDTKMFPGTPRSSFWSASPFVGVNDGTWYVEFATGYSAYFSSGGGMEVRCIRP